LHVLTKESELIVEQVANILKIIQSSENKNKNESLLSENQLNLPDNAWKSNDNSTNDRKIV